MVPSVAMLCIVLTILSFSWCHDRGDVFCMHVESIGDCACSWCMFFSVCWRRQEIVKQIGSTMIWNYNLVFWCTRHMVSLQMAWLHWEGCLVWQCWTWQLQVECFGLTLRDCKSFFHHCDKVTSPFISSKCCCFLDFAECLDCCSDFVWCLWDPVSSVLFENVHHLISPHHQCFEQVNAKADFYLCVPSIDHKKTPLLVWWLVKIAAVQSVTNPAFFKA